MRMKELSKTVTAPLAVPRTLRGEEIRNITSMPAGKTVPIAFWPLFREDKVRSGTLRISFEMMETVEILMNPVRVSVKAYLVPWLAFDRFEGMDQFNRSYEGQVPYEGGDVIPFFDTDTWAVPTGDNFYRYAGIHHTDGANHNSGYLEAYNQIFNYRARNRSQDITQRLLDDVTLAPAFWHHSKFRHIVPDFDQAMLDGEVALNVAQARMPLRGLGKGNQNFTVAGVNVYETDGTGTTNYANAATLNGSSANQEFYVREDADNPGFPDVFAELAANSITVSLSNIDMARKTVAFAKLRERYQGHSDDWIIDLLMDGITVPEQNFQYPMLIGAGEMAFGMSKRYATDAANMTASVVNGATFMDMRVTTPRIPTGGIVMIVAEAMPEQLFERQKDYYLAAQSVDDLPQYLRDELDPEKVAVVQNDHVDVDHSAPTATFGYAPLNHQWDRAIPRIGGRFYRPTVDAAFDEDRQRFWAVETADPVLSEDFYLCTTMHTKPFVDLNMDPFEVVTVGDMVIEGNTVFGAVLHEAQNNYEEVLAEAPQDRIEKA